MARFNRVVRLIAVREGGFGRLWDELRINFEVTQTTGKEPNSGRFDIYNLSKASRGYVQRAVGVILEAGYQESSVGTLFKGLITRVETQRPGGGDILTRIYCHDGLGAFSGQVISTTLGPGTSLGDVFRVVTEAAGITVRYVEEDLLTEALERSIENGITMHGPASWYLDDLAQRLGATWNIIDDELVFYRAGGLLPDQAILVSPETGLIQSPSELTKKRNSGRIEVIGLQWDMLLEHRMRPGSQCIVQSKDYEGPYIVQKVRHHGDSGFDNVYYSSVEATEVNSAIV